MGEGTRTVEIAAFDGGRGTMVTTSHFAYRTGGWADQTDRTAFFCNDGFVTVAIDSAW